jgi:hypothetical protein
MKNEKNSIHKLKENIKIIENVLYKIHNQKTNSDIENYYKSNKRKDN